MPGVLRVVVCGLMVMTLVASCGTDGEAGEESGTGDSVADVDATPETFIGALSGAAGDYQPTLTVAELGSQADLVVLATLGDPAPGREVFDTPASDEPYETTVVFTLDAPEVLGGTTPEIADQPFVVEIPTSSTRSAHVADDASLVGAFEGIVPSDLQVLLFLNEWDPSASGTRVTGEDPGVTYLVPRAQGLMVEGADGQILSNMEIVPDIEGLTFAEAAAKTRADVSAR